MAVQGRGAMTIRQPPAPPPPLVLHLPVPTVRRTRGAHVGIEDFDVADKVLQNLKLFAFEG